MNIFALHVNPRIAAQSQCDKHVCKMVLESAQMLATAHRVVEPYKDVDHDRAGLPRITHRNHPCSVWARETEGNYLWLYEHFVGLLDEYNHRYRRIHTYHDELMHSVLAVPPLPLRQDGKLRTEFVQCMPEQYKVPLMPHAAYKQYYRYKANHMDMKWTNRTLPLFMASLFHQETTT